MSLFDFRRKKLSGQRINSKSAVSVKPRRTKFSTYANIGGGAFTNGGQGAGGGMGSGIGGSGSSAFNTGGGNYGHSRYSGTYQAIELGSIINEWMPKDPVGMHTLWRQMYLHDSVCGTLVDIIAGLLWSTWDLMGLKDPGVLKIFENSMTNLKVETLMPALTVEHQVIGRVSGNLLFDEGIGAWNGFLPHDPDFIEISPLRVFGIDPKLDMRNDPGLSRLVRGGNADPRDEIALKMMPASLLNQLRKGKVQLSPENTLFVPRLTLLNDQVGTSLFTRAVPYFALESSLLSGTLIAARRRQRSILHLEVGLEDLWDPEPSEMDDIVNMFMQADEDPQGAIVATKKGVQIQEVRDGSNFWKISDEAAFINESKMRSLGVNEQLLSGDMNYNTMETALSVFVERLRYTRDHLTSKVFYQKVFPSLARVYGLRKINKNELEHRIKIKKSKEEEDREINDTVQKVTSHLDRQQIKRQKTYEQALAELQKAPTLGAKKDVMKALKKVSAEEATSIPDSELLFPLIHWHKQLRPEADENYLNILGTMEEKGIPIPLRSWAAAGGIDLENIMDMLKEDAGLRMKIQDWKRSAADDDQQAFAALTVDRKRIIASNLPIFKKKGEFMGVTKEDAEKYIASFKGRKYEMLAHVDDVEFDLNRSFDNNHKVEAMKFILKRIGMVNFEMHPDVVTAAVDKMKEVGVSYSKLMSEMNVIEKYSKVRPDKKQVTGALKESLAQGDAFAKNDGLMGNNIYAGLDLKK